MLDIKFIREQVDVVKRAVETKKASVDIDLLLATDQRRRDLLLRVEAMRAEQNSASDTIAKEKDPEAKKEAIVAMRQLKDTLSAEEAALSAVEAETDALLKRVPNIPSDDTPIGPDESANVIVRKIGEPRVFSFPIKDHVALGECLGIIDNETAGKVSGARFTYLKGALAHLQYALVQYVFSIVTDTTVLETIIKKAGLSVPATPFVPIVPPVMIRTEVLERMARLEPRDDRYYIPSDDLYLIGSAEHTLGPMHMDTVLAEEQLPLRYVACSPAFRREAGSYGKDMRGILRVHQFDKIEMESFCVPELSTQEQNLFVAIQEHIVGSLGIPYQVMQICTGDMGGPDSRQIDIECWMPGQQRYRETHTSDLMTDYQARQLNTRVKRVNGETQYVHMNDGTAAAIGRIFIALIENYQEEDGSVTIPAVLHRYLPHGLTRITKA
jgi:seryl-tRNA synthetase